VNIGGTECVSILEVARRVQEQMGIPQPLRATFLPYEKLPGNYQDVRDRIPDTTKARELLGFEAQMSFDEGVRRTIEWHRAMREAPVRAAAR
jgi:nucleoside-diphosphate-sugar epimerase